MSRPQRSSSVPGVRTASKEDESCVSSSQLSQDQVPAIEPLKPASKQQKVIVQLDNIASDHLLPLRTQHPTVHIRAKIHCSLCSRPVDQAKFLIGRGESLERQRVLPHTYGFSSSVLNWRIESELLDVGFESAVYDLDTPSKEPIFVLCMECFQIVGRFLAFRHFGLRCRSKWHIQSVADFYQCLVRQYSSDIHQGNDLRLYWPRGDYTNNQYAWSWAPLTRRWICHLPFLSASITQPIPSLPKYILSKLKPLTQESTKCVRFMDSKYQATSTNLQSSVFHNLPTEIILLVAKLSDITSVFSMRETCHRFAQVIKLDQWFWYSRFINKELLGFLWKHDTQDVVKEVHRKAERRNLLPNTMDWMQLIKALANYESFLGGGCFNDAPPGFRNRRRVWKILESMEEMGCVEGSR